jgi:hypothetical protein
MEFAVLAVMPVLLKVMVVFYHGCFEGLQAFFFLFFCKEEASNCCLVVAVEGRMFGGWQLAFSVCMFCMFAWEGISISVLPLAGCLQTSLLDGSLLIRECGPRGVSLISVTWEALGLERIGSVSCSSYFWRNCSIAGKVDLCQP